MAQLRVDHTADLEPATLAAVRGLLFDVFGDDMSEADWEHALGGVHALVVDDGVVIGHGAVVQRRLLYAGRALRAGYVEGVAVRGDRRGAGHGRALMEALHRVIGAAYDVGALAAAEDAFGFYARMGWQRWQGQTFSLTPAGLRRTADDDGGIFVLPLTMPLELSAGLACDWRDGDVW
ncbi:MAG: GNAT family N-acetyltransferase [Mycobacterium sp.]|nr:GNAT family N-acetyltransferase [Mycobacterium sp.]